MDQFNEQKPPQNLLVIFQEAFLLFKANASVYLPLGLIFGFSGVLDQLVFKLFNAELPVLTMTIGILLNTWASIALIDASSRLYQGKEAPLNDVLSKHMHRFPTYMLVSIGEVVIVMAGVLALIIPGIYLATIFVFANICVILENTDVRGSFRSSAELVKRDFWRVLNFYALVFIFVLMPQMAVEVVLAEATSIKHSVYTLMLVFIMPYFSILMVVFYYRFKEEHPDIDPSLMA